MTDGIWLADTARDRDEPAAYHVDADCPHLVEAAGRERRPLDEVDLDPCPTCTGQHELFGETVQLLAEADPDEIPPGGGRA